MVAAVISVCSGWPSRGQSSCSSVGLPSLGQGFFLRVLSGNMTVNFIQVFKLCGENLDSLSHV